MMERIEQFMLDNPIKYALILSAVVSVNTVLLLKFFSL